MIRIKVLFYIEHIEREIDTIKSIIQNLKLNENDYVICSTTYSMGISKFLFYPDIVIVPWLYTDYCYKKLFSFPAQNKIKILNLHHEQITNLDRIDALLPSGKAKSGFHICWGGNFQKKLQDIGIVKDKIKTTGSTRLKKSVNILSKLDIANDYFNDGSYSNKKWIMFVSSFSWKNLPDTIIKKVEKNGRKNVWEYKEIVQSSYFKTLDWIENYLKIDSENLYIYRLHPSESIDSSLIDLDRKYSNFKIVSDLPISCWIQHCDVIDLWISTSIAEIFVYNKPVRIIRPIELPDNVEVEGFEKLSKVTSKEEFLSLSFQIPYNKEKSEDYLRKFYSFGINSDLSTAKFVDYIINEEQEESIKLSFITRCSFAIKESLKDILKIFLSKSGLIKYTSYARLGKSTKCYGDLSYFEKEDIK